MRFQTLQNIKKLLVTQRFGAPEKVDGNALQNLSNMKTFGTLFAKWLGKVSKKHYVFH